MADIHGWNDISERNRALLTSFIDTFTLKDGTQLTSDIFDQGDMLGLEMFMLARAAIIEAMSHDR